MAKDTKFARVLKATLPPTKTMQACDPHTAALCSSRIVGNRFLGTLSRYCLGRSLSFAMLPSLNTVECHQHGCVPCAEQTLFLFSTIWWSNSRNFLLIQLHLGIQERQLLQFRNAANSMSTQVAQQHSSHPQSEIHTFEKKKTWSPTCLPSDQKEERTRTRQKQLNHHCVVLSFPSLPTTISKTISTACTTRKRNCSAIALLPLILNVLPSQLILPPVSGVPTGPTCRQRNRVLLASGHYDFVLSDPKTILGEQSTLLSCTHMAAVLLFRPRARAKNILRVIPPTDTNQLKKHNDEAMEVTNRTCGASPEPSSGQSSKTN